MRRGLSRMLHGRQLRIRVIRCEAFQCENTALLRRGEWGAEGDVVYAIACAVAIDEVGLLTCVLEPRYALTHSW
jgi:hypothetical protein